MRKTEVPAKQGSGNVFADLGLPNLEQDLLNARLTLQIWGRMLRSREADTEGTRGDVGGDAVGLKRNRWG